MPLLGSTEIVRGQDPPSFTRRPSVTSPLSPFAHNANLNNMSPLPLPATPEAQEPRQHDGMKRLPTPASSASYFAASVMSRSTSYELHDSNSEGKYRAGREGFALNDTPAPTAPNSPDM